MNCIKLSKLSNNSLKKDLSTSERLNILVDSNDYKKLYKLVDFVKNDYKVIQLEGKSGFFSNELLDFISERKIFCKINIDTNFTEKKNSFNLFSSISKKNIMKLVVNILIYPDKKLSDLKKIDKTISWLSKNNINKIQFTLCDRKRPGERASFEQLINVLSSARYVSFSKVIKKVNGIPYCIFSDPEELVIRDLSHHKERYFKLDKCKKCSLKNNCSGIPRIYKNEKIDKFIKPEKKLKEVTIELTSKCNFGCKFCFNKASFAKDGRGGDEMGTEKIKKIIDQIKKSGVSVVRFTGGEPLLRSDLMELLLYTRNKGLKVRLNTNGYLIRDYEHAKKLAKYLDYVLFSFHAYDFKKEEKITGVKNSFQKKIQAIKWLRKAGVNTIRINTVASVDNIKNLEKFYNLFKELKIDSWATNRLIPVFDDKCIWGKKELGLLVKKLVKIKEDINKNNIPLRLHIVNAVPLCAMNPITMNRVCIGGRSVDGHERFVIDPRGFAKPIYYIDKNIGDACDIKGSWENNFMKSLRSYVNLPAECKKCSLLEKCKGGNRYCAFVATGNFFGKDPLMNYNNINDFVW